MDEAETLDPEDRDARQRSGAVIVEQHAKYIVNAEGSEGLVIGDTVLRESSESEFHQPDVFANLSDVLSHSQLHPNLYDLEHGAYYRNADLHERVRKQLNETRRCLIRGRPGRGKSALAKAIGLELLRSDSQSAVFYLNAKDNARLVDWVRDMRPRDREHVTFIIDDCHRAVDAVNGLVSEWFRLQKSRLILVSRPLDERLATSDETNYLSELSAESISLDHEHASTDFLELISAVVRQAGAAWRDPGPLDAVIRRCEGDLFILDYLVKAWLAHPETTALADVDINQIGESLYDRYVPRHTQYPSSILTIAALSQFEIDVESAFIGSSEVIDSIKENAFVESSGEMNERLRFFHSTPAKYLVEGKLGESARTYTLSELLRYAAWGPENLFDVFRQLAMNGEDELRSALLSDDRVQTAVTAFVARGQALTDLQLRALFRFLEDCESLGRRSVTDFSLVAQVRRDIALAEWAHFIPHRELTVITKYLRQVHVSGAVIPQVLVDAGGLRALGERVSATVTRVEVLRFLEIAKLAAVSSTGLKAFLGGVNLRSLGERSSAAGFNRLRKDADRVRELGMDRDAWREFWTGIDCQALGVEARDHSLAQVWNFIVMAQRAGLDGSPRLSFLAGLDLVDLGKRSRNSGFSNVARFIREARRGGIRDSELAGFCAELDWRALGANVGADEGKGHFYSFRLVGHHDRCIDSNMSRDFIEGFGWDRLRILMTATASPDVLAVLRNLLKRKCRYTDAELISHGIDLQSEDLWLGSFRSRPCSRPEPTQEDVSRSVYLREALATFLSFAPTDAWFRSLDLKGWNILTNNVWQADPEYFSTVIASRIAALDGAAISRLLASSDLYNVGRFLGHFNVQRGVYRFSLPADVAVDLESLIDGLEVTDLASISRVLFNLQEVGLGRDARAFARYLQENLERIGQPIERADLSALDWFAWNFWHSLPADVPASLFESGLFRSAVLSRSKHLPDETVFVLGIAGCMALSGVPLDRTTREVDKGRARQACRTAAENRSPTLIRLIAGALAIGLLGAEDQDGTFYTTALRQTVEKLQVRSARVATAVSSLLERLSPAQLAD